MLLTGVSPDQLAAALTSLLAPQPAPAEPEPAADGDAEPAAYDVHEFCRAHRIGRAMLFKLRNEDRRREAELGRPLLREERRAPRCKAIGQKLIISREAAREWRNRYD